MICQACGRPITLDAIRPKGTADNPRPTAIARCPRSDCAKLNEVFYPRDRNVATVRVIAE